MAVSGADARLTANRYALVVLRKGSRRRPDRLFYDVYIRPEGHRDEIKVASFMHEGEAIQHARKLARRADCEIRNYIP